MEKKHSTLNNFILLKTLGSGFNSKVKLAMHKETGDKFAIKVIRDTSHVDSNIKAILNEAKVLQELDHPNIITLHEVSDKGLYTKSDGRSKNVMYAVLQLAQGGEIFEYLANTGRFSEPVARFYFKQMINALDHCHSKGFAHRDLKPENLLLDEKFNLILADFGFAVLLSGRDGTGKLRTMLGTESYMAPEIHSKAPYVGTSVDLFAAGIILFIFLTGHPPFNQAKATDPYYNMICMNNHEKFWLCHSRKKPNGKKFFSPEFKSLMNAMLAFDPTQRPSMSEIKAHPWFNGPTATHEDIVAEFTKRKEHVDRSLEKQRIIEARKKAAKKQNIAFQGVKAKFRDVITEAEGENSTQTQNFDKMMNELNSIKEGGELELVRQDAAELDLGVKVLTVHHSVADPISLFKTAICSAYGLKNAQVKTKNDKLSIKVRVPTEFGHVAAKMKVSSDSENGTILDFYRAEGPSLDYFNLVKKIKASLDEAEEIFMNVYEKEEAQE